MKRVLKFAVPALLLVVANSASALVADTKHNLVGSATTDNGQMCVYCHAPHTADVAPPAPLWNRTENTSTGYTVYSSTTLNMAIGQPGSESLICLGCHDGATALDAILNTPESGWVTNGTAMASTAAGYMGTDLRSEHPIGVTYNTALDGAFVVDPTALTEIQLFSNVVECASCHAVHDYTNVPFLRMSNANSALCLACHQK